jgi:hypothetical protein
VLSVSSTGFVVTIVGALRADTLLSLSRDLARKA